MDVALALTYSFENKEER